MFKPVIACIAIILFPMVLFSGCSHQTQSIDESKKIVFGTSVGDFGDMVRDSITPQLEKKGYQITLKEFSDYVMPNKMLAEKGIDINIFQHRPYLDNFMQRESLDLIAIFEVPTATLGIYPGKLSSLKTHQQENITIGVPNDATNLARALSLLENIGYITIQPNIDKQFATLKAIERYNRPMQIIELDAAALPSAKETLGLAVINGNYAISSGIDISTALAYETSKNYINIAVIRREDQDSQWVKDVTEAYNSKEFKRYAKEKFKGYHFPNIW